MNSGAVGTGATILNYKNRPKDIKKMQVASAVGQIDLIYTYKKIFEKQ